MKKDEALNMESTEILITDLLVRVTAVENVLVAKGIFTLDELNAEIKVLSTKLAKMILQQANVPGDLDVLIDSFGKKNEDKN